MLGPFQISVVLPAYNAAATLAQTAREIDRSVVDSVLLVDDASDDATLEVARSLGLEYVRHERNLGYGANQKTCYRVALERGRRTSWSWSIRITSTARGWWCRWRR